MPNDLQKRYLLVAIDRATRWVYLEVIDDKGAKTTAAFIQHLHEKCPVNIKIILTMTTTLEHYMKLYNQHIVQRNLGHSTPVQTMKEWYRKKPELFKKRVYNQSGLDNYLMVGGTLKVSSINNAF